MTRQAGHIFAQSFGEGPEVVMVHGWGMHSGVWCDFAEQLAERFRVTLIDLPGHGRSGMQAGFNLDGLADAFLGVAPANAHWLGWSLGAAVGLQFSHRYPERVMSLAMLAGNARFSQCPDWPFAMDSETLAKFASDMLADAHHTLLRFLGLQVWGLTHAKDLMKQLKARVEECEPPDSSALQAGLQILREADLRVALATLQRPLQLLMGGRDRLVPVLAGHAMVDLAPDASLHVIADAGHVPFLTHSDECVRVLSEFWQCHAQSA